MTHPTSNLVTQLREGWSMGAPREAADEIERLRADLSLLERCGCRIVERLGRRIVQVSRNEAVDEIERLRAALQRIKDIGDDPDNQPPCVEHRIASEALSGDSSQVETTPDVRALFNKGIGVQKGNRFSFSFETEDEANRAFHYIADLGTLETSQPPKSAQETEPPRITFPEDMPMSERIGDPRIDGKPEKASACDCPEVCKVCGGRAKACALLGHRPEGERYVKWHKCAPKASVYPSYCKFCGGVTPCGCPAGSVVNGSAESGK